MRPSKLAPLALALASAACSDVAPMGPHGPALRPSLSLAAPVVSQLGCAFASGQGAANAIDAAGVVYGMCNDDVGIPRAVRFGGGTATLLLPLEGDVESQVFAVSPNGRHRVGFTRVGEEWQKLLRWTHDEPPVVLSEGLNRAVYEVNDAGQAVGELARDDGRWVAVRWEADGSASYLTSEYEFGMAWAINAAGDVVGYLSAGDDTYRAFRWRGGALELLGRPGGVPDGRLPYEIATDINDAGVVVGYQMSVDPETGEADYRAVRWDASGAASTPFPSWDRWTGFGFINNRGLIAGSWQDESGVWMSAVFVDDVPTLLPIPSQATSGFVTAMNDAGQIAGSATGASGEYWPLLWTIPSANAAPVIQQATPPQAVARAKRGLPLPVNFVWSDEDRDGGPWAWRIEWGDGQVTTGINVQQSAVTASHVYATPGAHTLRFTITDGGGASATRTIELSVRP